MENERVHEAAENTAPSYKRWKEPDEFQATMSRVMQYLQILKEWMERRQAKQRARTGELEEEQDGGRVSP